MQPVAQASAVLEPALLSTVHYLVLGVPIAVSSDIAGMLEYVDDTYTAFRQGAGTQAPLFSAELLAVALGDVSDPSGAVIVRDSGGYRHEWPDAHTGLLDLLDRIVRGLLIELHRRDIYAIHAGALVYRGAALLIAGRSGQGKTTLTLGLVGRGLGLLSDEFAIADPASQQLLPYRRSLHVRPGTPELIPELAFLQHQPQQRLGGGIEWSLAPAEVARVFPGSLAPAAPLRYVLLLDGAPQPDRPPSITPAPAALATMELLRGTWAASRDFAGGLAHLSRLMNGVVCARLQSGALDATLDAISTWLEAQRG
jgi:hypothetical protein